MGAISYCILVYIYNKLLQFRFAFMHCITSSLCFWVSTIIDETVDTVVKAELKYDDDNNCHDTVDSIGASGSMV